MAGHRDLVGGAVAHARLAVDEDGAEEHDVAEEREGLESQRERDPLGARVGNARDAVVNGSVGARQRGEHDRGGQSDQSGDEDWARQADPARCRALNGNGGCEAGHGSIIPSSA